MMEMKVSESTEGSVILQKKGKRVSPLQRKVSLPQSLLCPRGPEAAATRWLPKHFSPLLNSAEKPIPGNPQRHSLLGPLVIQYHWSCFYHQLLPAECFISTTH